MTAKSAVQAPADAAERRARRPVVVYPNGTLPAPDMARLEEARATLEKIDEIVVPPRDGGAFEVPKGHFFRVVSIEGPQVGDLNLWNAADLSERFFSGKTRALHATHVSVGDRLWSSLPHLRPMATITHDTLAWYGWDDDGAGLHDVIGTRCDPYTNRLLSGGDYHHCCHSNLTRALAGAKGLAFREAEPYVHDVLNVFMCTGFTSDTHQYFMKASPVRPGDYIEFFAEIDLIGALSACPGGDCSTTHSSDAAACYPLKVEIFRPDMGLLKDWPFPERNGYRNPE
ncbi:urea carboxylase-associated family protein [Ciceribacter azotifigens]|uniref:urea carboxylase-associated family protein n=1 Tax=Ciceribacter azotifigens TaxID=2069303 RepID=UPI003A8B1466